LPGRAVYCVERKEKDLQSADARGVGEWGDEHRGVSMDLAALNARLDELEERYQTWAAPIYHATREYSYKVNRDGYTASDFERDIRVVREAQRANYDPYPAMHAFLDELCPAYLAATPAEREQVRSAVSDKKGILSALLGYAFRCSEWIQSPSDTEWLRKGLAAVSIENCRQDFRDVLLALADLYVAAEEVGIEPRPEFEAVSRLSSDEKPEGGTTAVSAVLADFHRSAALIERKQRQGESGADG
jgi:hypothetical protein